MRPLRITTCKRIPGGQVELMTLKHLLFLAFVWTGQLLFAQEIPVSTLSESDLPKGLSYQGKLKKAVRWFDESGVNLLLTTETEETVHPDADSEDYRDKSLYAYHFLLYEDSMAQTWKVSDYVRECPLDILLNFIPGTLQVTDLDQDGIGEVWLMYHVDCLSDVSPVGMKIIVYEGKQKYAMRGENIVEPSKGQFIGGNYQFDKAFNQGPEVFRDFAKKLWKANSKQKW